MRLPLLVEERRDAYAVAAVLAVAAAAFAVAWSPVDFLFLLGTAAAFAFVMVASDRTLLFLLGLSFPFQGLRISVPVFQDALLLRLFPDGIDLPIGYALAGLLILALLVRWFLALAGRKLPKPSLPLAGAAALFWASAAVSSFAAGDDRLLSFKYAIYPIAFSYIAYALLPAQLVRVEAELRSVAKGMVWAGAIVAAMGAVSLFVGQAIGPWRAAPLPIFGVWPIGDNHNLLAETLVATVPLALYLAATRRSRERFILNALAALMTFVALMTFARTAWIAFACMLAVAAAFEYRELVRPRLRRIALVGLLLVPLAALFVMTSSTREVGGSTASRLAMTEFALYLFSTHPIVGAGAGTFETRLGQSQDFTEDFGAPLDAHGFGQKILSEQGIVGMVLFLFLLGRVLQVTLGAVRAAEPGSSERRTLLLFALPAVGMIVYEAFNTTYYSPKMWLPIGVALAALPVLMGRKAPAI